MPDPDKLAVRPCQVSSQLYCHLPVALVVPPNKDKDEQYHFWYVTPCRFVVTYQLLEGSRFRQNVSKFLRTYTASYARR
jgi:hypothetical protein